MKRKSLLMRFVACASFFLALQLCTLFAVQADNDNGKGRDDDKGKEESERVKRGFELARPLRLNLRGKNRSLVGLGSYIVNAQGGCNDCHTHPSYTPGHDPFLGQPEQINVGNYLSGGREFGPPGGLASANITPDANGKPAGLDLNEFISALRTGHDPDDPAEILQVMPWPVYGKMIERDLRAIYEFLRAIPSLPDNPHPGP